MKISLMWVPDADPMGAYVIMIFSSLEGFLTQLKNGIHVSGAGQFTVVVEGS